MGQYIFQHILHYLKSIYNLYIRINKTVKLNLEDMRNLVKKRLMLSDF